MVVPVGCPSFVVTKATFDFVKNQATVENPRQKFHVASDPPGQTLSWAWLAALSSTRDFFNGSVRTTCPQREQITALGTSVSGVICFVAPDKHAAFRLRHCSSRYRSGFV